MIIKSQPIAYCTLARYLKFPNNLEQKPAIHTIKNNQPIEFSLNCINHLALRS